MHDGQNIVLPMPHCRGMIMSLSQKILVCLFARFRFDSSPRGVGERLVSFRAMAWNIWHGGREDGEQIGPQRVVDIIEGNRVDIVAMQETYGSGSGSATRVSFPSTRDQRFDSQSLSCTRRYFRI